MCVCVYSGTTHKCPDYQGVQVSLYDKAPFGTITKCVDYAGVSVFKCPDYCMCTHTHYVIVCTCICGMQYMCMRVCSV